MDQVKLNSSFAEWVKEGNARNGWSIRELGRRSGFSHAHISNAMRGVKRVTYEMCEAIAVAFEQTPESAFRRVGLLPPNRTEAEKLQEILNYLPPESRAEVLRYAEWKRRETVTD